MSEEKETIILRVSPELKKAVKTAAALDHRKMANFIESVLLGDQRVKKALVQAESKSLENDAEKEKESPRREKEKKNTQKIKEQKEEQEVTLERMKHNF